MLTKKFLLVVGFLIFTPVLLLFTNKLHSNQQVYSHAQIENSVLGVQGGQEFVWAKTCEENRITIDGIGMGSSSSSVNPQSIQLEKWEDANWMTLQVGGKLEKGINLPEYVMFSTSGESRKESAPSADTPLSYTFIAEHMEPGSMATAQVKEPAANHSPRAFVVYAEMDTKSEYWSSFGSTKNHYIYGDSDVDDYFAENLLISPLPNTSDMIITVVVMDNNNDNRHFTVEANAGGVSGNASRSSSTDGDLLNIIKLELPAVPQGTKQVNITVSSPKSNGDSVVLIGYNIAYQCAERIPISGTFTINEGEEITQSRFVDLQLTLSHPDIISSICVYEVGECQPVPIKDNQVIPWTLSSNPGVKLVNVEIIDQYNNLYNLSDTIELIAIDDSVHLPLITFEQGDPCDYEPNNTSKDAYGPIKQEYTYCETLDAYGHDIYKIELDNPARVYVEVLYKGDLPIPEYTLTIFDCNKDRIIWGDQSNARPSSIVLNRKIHTASPACNTHYFDIYAKNITSSKPNYEIKWMVIP